MSDMRKLFGRSITRSGRIIRDAWLIAGGTVLLIVALESGYRLYDTVSTASMSRSADDKGPPSPFEATAWAAEYWIGHDKEEAVEWTPYVYVRNPKFEAPHHSVDHLGHRVTPLPAPASPGGPTVRVFFMGGSTTFGWFQRADHTIPAEAARRLQTQIGNNARVDVTNFGVPGHTFTQEVLELILQLRAGARPDVVVFYDGINDVMATVQNKRAGLPQNEGNRVEDFVRGRREASENKPGLVNDLLTAKHMLGAALSRIQFAKRIVNWVRATGSSTAAPSNPAELAKNIVQMHAENARIVEALAASYGFQPIYVWQPALLSTRKPLTAHETWLRRAEVGNFVRTMRDVHMTVPTLIGPAMKPIAGDRFIEMTDLFRDDPDEIFVDWSGHTYERANPRIVDALMPRLGAAVSWVMSRPSSVEVPHSGMPTASTNDSTFNNGRNMVMKVE